MIDDHLHTQAALYALDALPADEIAAFRAKMSEVSGLAELVAEYEEVAATVAETAPKMTPPPALRDRIMATISPKPEVVESRRMVWLPWALAAGFAFFAGALWVENQRLTAANSGQRAAWVEMNDQISRMNSTLQERDLLEGALTRQIASLSSAGALKDHIAEQQRGVIAQLQQRNTIEETQVATLTSKLDGSYLASIAWDNSSQEGVLHVRRLPAISDGKNYQLWVIDPKNAAPVSAGVFTVQADGSATIRFSPTQKVSSATAFAVSVEKPGGSTSPEGPVVLSN